MAGVAGLAVTGNTPGRRSLRGLDALAFFLADVRDGVGPFLAIYLLATHDWDPLSIGVAMSALRIATMVSQLPVGALIDRSRHKRVMVAAAAVVVGFACIAMTMWPTLPGIITAQSFVGIAASVFPPAIGALSLGLVGHRHLSTRIGRNEGFNHAGNVVTALLAGIIGHFVAREGIFYLVATVAVISAISVLFIREEEIDHEVARGAKAEKNSGEEKISGFGAILRDRRILAFALAIALFHFANAAMLPLVGQYMADGTERGASLYMSASIVVAQTVMIPVAVLAGKWSERWGRKPILLIGFAVLPIRGLLYTLSDNPVFLVSVQILDGIAAGIHDVLWVIVVADLTQGTGRFNVTQGGINTAHQIGAAFSAMVAGYAVAAAGYNAGFITLSGIALVALAVLYFFVPETRVAPARS